SFASIRLQHFEKARRKIGCIENCADEHEHAMRVLMHGELHQRVANFGIVSEALGAADEPEIEIALQRPHVRGELGVKAFGIVDEVTGVHFEKTGERHARRVGEMRTKSSLDLREIRLTDPLAELALDCRGDRLLRHLAIESAKGPFNGPEIPEFLANFHITDRYM